MLVSALVLTARFVIHVADHHLNFHLNRRSIGAKHYVKLCATLLTCTLELIFFGVLWSKVGPPLHLLGELYIIIRTLTHTARSVAMYRTNCALIDKCPIPTNEEIQRDASCVICMEDMTGQGVEGSKASRKLPCGHIFHSHCLYRFVEKDRSCPICRRDYGHIANAPVARPQGALAPAQAPAAADRMPTDEEMEAAFQEYRRQASTSSVPKVKPPEALPPQETPRLIPAAKPDLPTPVIPTPPALGQKSPRRPAAPSIPHSAVGAMPGMSLQEVRAFRQFHSRMADALGDLEKALAQSEGK